jgi:hypothetical protein
MLEEDDQIHVYKLYGIATPRKFRAKKSLRNRIGDAFITATQIQKAQEIIDRKQVDYGPYVYSFLEQVYEAINHARKETYLDDVFYNRILIPMVQIKGQAAMFGNNVAGELAGSVVNFMERYQLFDDDMLNIIQLCADSIKLSYVSDLSDLERPKAQLLLSELKYAMERYHARFKKKTGR